MSNDQQTPTWTRRLFRYDDKTFDTVPEGTTIEEAKTMLAMYLPELANATHSETVEDDVLIVTFHKQATTKGAQSEATPSLIDALFALPPIENPTENLYEQINGQPITLALLAEHATLLQKAAAYIEANRYLPQQLIARCCRLLPIPARFVPLGF